MKNTILFIIFGICVFLFTVIDPNIDIPLEELVKSIPAFVLAIFIFTETKGSSAVVLGISFILCGIADYIIHTEYSWSRITGILIFLAAHLLLAVSFFMQVKSVKGKIPHIIFFSILPIIIFAIFNSYYGDMMIPVAFYLLCITAMIISAFLRERHAEKPILILGAITFYISDFILSIHYFVSPIPNPYDRYVILGTYFTAILLIALGYVDDYRSRQRVQPKT